MRIWDLPPALLCRQHLLGEHRELHGLWIVLTQRRAGYRGIRKRGDGKDGWRLCTIGTKSWSPKCWLAAINTDLRWIRHLPSDSRFRISGWILRANSTKSCAASLAHVRSSIGPPTTGRNKLATSMRRLGTLSIGWHFPVHSSIIEIIVRRVIQAK